MVSNEAEWLHAAKQWDENALTAIYEAYSSELYRYAYRLLGNEAGAEDIVGETFHRFLRALQGGGGPEDHLRAYLYRVAHNLAIDRHRREPVPPADVDAIQHQSSDGLSPEEAAGHSLAAAAVRRKLWLLTDDQRLVIMLKYYQGFSNAETAQALGKPVGAIKSLQHRALRSLQRMLERDEKEHGYEEELVDHTTG